jgi:manganese oxidase
MYLPLNSSSWQQREAEAARNNRLEIVSALSTGEISRRDLFRWGLFTTTGGLAATHGLSPFVSSAHAQVPTGVPRSPLFGAAPFTQPMPRPDVLPRIENPMSTLFPVPLEQSNQTQQTLNPALVAAYPGGNRGPIEGRPPGRLWGHQKWQQFLPRVGYEVTQRGVQVNTSYRPGVPPSLNSGINPAAPIAPAFHRSWPVQNTNSVWTFNGSVPPKLILARYGEPILFRHHNRLPFDPRQNNGFGRHTITTHEHNGHHGAENDGFTGAFFFPGQFYDYHWPVVHAGFTTFNTNAGDPRCGTPNGSGGITRLPGDWRETMSSHWFHDHMFEFTAQNVYKGNAGLMNLYSSLDRGNEAINDGVNLRLPSGTAKDWGNLDYDVNLMLADKAFNSQGQLIFDIFDTDGFLGDAITVNLAYKPYFEVERRKYRFRILNGSVARIYKLALSDGKPFHLIANDGNLLPASLLMTSTGLFGVAERLDIIIDFTQWPVGGRVQLVNQAEHNNGRKVNRTLSLREALAGSQRDPGVGSFLEFRVVRNPAQPDRSQIPQRMIENPSLNQPVARTRDFRFGRGAKQTLPIARTLPTASEGPWGIRTNGGDTLAAAYSRVSAAPKIGTREIWNLRNGGGGWDHPIHIHFEEGQILTRDGSAANVPAWERGRKDVFRLEPGGEMTVSIQFRDWGGMFMKHCHTTTHEDHAMLMRWDLVGNGAPSLVPMPTPLPRPQGVTFAAVAETLPGA